jgi:hypothetical protein
MKTMNRTSSMRHMSSSALTPNMDLPWCNISEKTYSLRTSRNICRMCRRASAGQMVVGPNTRVDTILVSSVLMVQMASGSQWIGHGFVHAMVSTAPSCCWCLPRPLPAGKCLCDPEGGTCKSAASFYENHSDGGNLLSSWDFYAFCEAHLKTPDKALSKKRGRGIYRRHFYYVPAQGEGAVNYNIPRWTKIKKSNGIHQMIGGVIAGLVKCRGRSCHCVPCYRSDYDECEYFEFMKQEMMWEQPDDMVLEAAGHRPELRGDQEKKGHAMAMVAEIGQWAAFLVHGDEAWMIGKILQPALGCAHMGELLPRMAMAKGIPGMADGELSKVVQTTTQVVDENKNWMGTLEVGDDIVYVQKWEARVTRGSSRSEFIETAKCFGCFSGDTRHVGFSMKMKPLGPVPPVRVSKRKHASSAAIAVPATKAIQIACLTQEDKTIILLSLASAT